MKLASVERIKSVRVHPNADRLEIVEVLGYNCIVPKGLYTTEEYVILIQPDTVLPDEEWTAFYKKQSSKRVKACKLRGEWSYGIVESLNRLTYRTLDIPFPKVQVGEEVSHLLGITKYEAPVATALGVKGYLPYSIPKTDEERYQNLDLEEMYGQTVDVTLKVDGQSFTTYYKDAEFGVAGRTQEFFTDKLINAYTAHIERYDLKTLLARYCIQHKVNLALRGESYGKGIQANANNPHSKLEPALAFFSVYLIDEHRYTYTNHTHSLWNVCSALDLPTVPFIERGVVLTPELVRKYGDDLTTLNGQPFEGVVIAGRDFSFKVINKYYDSKK